MSEYLPKEYIWVVGTSGVGKETFIRQLIDERNEALRKTSNIKGNDVQIFGPGFSAYNVQSLVDVYNHQVLIKWQFRDHKHIREIITTNPRGRYRALLLWRPYETQIQDLLRRSPTFKDSVDTLKFDWIIIKRLFQKLREQYHLPLFWIDVSSQSYTFLPDWP